MNKEEFNTLLKKYEDGLCDAAERALVESWYNSFAERKPRLALSEDLNQTKDLIWSKVQQHTLKKSVRIPIYSYAAIAAAIAVITLGVWLYPPAVILNLFQDPNAIATTNDIAPGRNTATLTLASGEVINLDTNKTSVVVTDSVRTPMLLTASTPRGGTYQFTLPDGTKVWLNADSKLEFPSNFENKKQRIVKLFGEGYFEVAKNKTKPFIVESREQRVEVLGTHFNINSYADEGGIKTTLLEGSVEVSSTDVKSGLRYRLKPNQQSSLKGDAIKVTQVDASEAIDWKNGDFVITSESLSSIMRKVSRWYDVKVVYMEGVDQDQTFSGSVSRSKNISQVLEVMSSSRQVKFTIEGKTITVMK